MEKIDYQPTKKRPWIYWSFLVVAIILCLYFGDDKLWQRAVGIVLMLGVTALFALFAGIFWPSSFIKRLKILYVVILFVMAFVMWTNQGYKTSTSAYPDSTQQDARSIKCPHCSGSGQRINNISGRYGKCASCDGTGWVTQWQYDHMTK